MYAPAGDRANWQLGLRGLLLSLSLVGISDASGSQLPMLAAVVIAAWSAISPLRLGRWLMQPSTLRMAGALLTRLAAVVLAGALLSFAVNSPSPLLNVPGTLLFLALTATVMIAATRYTWEQCRTLAPRIWASSLEAAATLRTHAEAALGAARYG